jgi:hypothetical protein
MRTQPDRLVALGAALTMSGVLLAMPFANQKPPPAPPTTAELAWPHAQRASLTADLPDGATFQPGIFLDAHTSVGTAPSPDQRFLRLVVRSADAPIRQLRRLPLPANPSFANFTVAGNILAWVEHTDSEQLSLWTTNLRDGRPARQLTADTGNPVFDSSQYDLLIAAGRLYWTATNPEALNTTEVRSIALTGGPVDTRVEPGTWKLSAWPWLVTGRGEQTGTTKLRNMTTNQTIAVSSAGRYAMDCSPTWCHVVALSRTGYRVDLMRPDGTNRQHLTDGAALPAIVDVAPLDRFELLAQLGPYSDLTGTRQLLAYDLATHQTVQVSPDARAISYNNGVLWWASGNLSTPLWHTLDLHTI